MIVRKRKTKGVCTVCGGPHHAKGLCATHYRRARQDAGLDKRSPRPRKEGWCFDCFRFGQEVSSAQGQICNLARRLSKVEPDRFTLQRRILTMIDKAKQHKRDSEAVLARHLHDNHSAAA